MVCSLLLQRQSAQVFQFIVIQLGQLQIQSVCMLRNKIFSSYIQQSQGMCLAGTLTHW